MFSGINNPASYVVNFDSHSLVFHRPPRQKRVGKQLIGFFAACLILTSINFYHQELVYRAYLDGFTGNVWNFSPDFHLIASVSLGSFVLWGPFIALFVFLNAPHRLSLDLGARSYTLDYGYKFFSRVYCGSLDDIENLQIRSKYQNATMQRLYSIVLVWKPHAKPKKPGIMLSTGYDKWEAETLVYQYANTLGVRVVNNL